MNFKEILELIDKVADRGISGIEIEQAGTKVRIEGKPSQQQHVFASYVTGGEAKSDPHALPSIPVHALPAPSGGRADEKKPAAEADPSLHVITSPMVGTFFSAPNPEAPPYVRVGDRVKIGQVLCIVEAMKLMNPIDSDVDGVIVEIHTLNKQPIEYGERLFSIKV